MAKVTPNLSSATLFHFTKKREWLQSIISEGFLARYCYDKFPKKRLAYLAPMVCFCDIPLGLIKYHLSRYGGYGIGINKKYLRELGVTPIMYVHSNSKQLTVTGTDKNLEELKTNPFTPYIKIYYGAEPEIDENRKHTGTKNVRFINEKEWRYVPPNFPVETRKFNKEQELIDWKDTKNQSATFTKLEVPLEKIEYFFLAQKKDMTPFIDFIDDLHTSKTIRDLLISKIVLQGSILRDF
jgi:hypothetical protein